MKGSLSQVKAVVASKKREVKQKVWSNKNGRGQTKEDMTN